MEADMEADMAKKKKKLTKAPPALVDLVEEARQLRLQAEELARRMLAVQGTRPDVEPPPTDTPDDKPVNYHVGDHGSTDELTEVVLMMLSERPMWFRDIVETTGARANRIKGVIVRLQREGHRVIDLAPEGALKALWFIPSDAVLDRLFRARSATAKL